MRDWIIEMLLRKKGEASEQQLEAVLSGMWNVGNQIKK